MMGAWLWKEKDLNLFLLGAHYAGVLSEHCLCMSSNILSYTSYHHILSSVLFELEAVWCVRFSFHPDKIISAIFYIHIFFLLEVEKGALELSCMIFLPFILGLQSPTHLSALNLISRCRQPWLPFRELNIGLCHSVKSFVHSMTWGLMWLRTNLKAICNQIIDEIRSFNWIFISKIWMLF